MATNKKYSVSKSSKGDFHMAINKKYSVSKSSEEYFNGEKMCRIIFNENVCGPLISSNISLDIEDSCTIDKNTVIYAEKTIDNINITLKDHSSIFRSVIFIEDTSKNEAEEKKYFAFIARSQITRTTFKSNILDISNCSFDDCSISGNSFSSENCQLNSCLAFGNQNKISSAIANHSSFCNVHTESEYSTKKSVVIDHGTLCNCYVLDSQISNSRITDSIVIFCDIKRSFITTPLKILKCTISDFRGKNIKTLGLPKNDSDILNYVDDFFPYIEDFDIESSDSLYLFVSKKVFSYVVKDSKTNEIVTFFKCDKPGCHMGSIITPSSESALEVIEKYVDNKYKTGVLDFVASESDTLLKARNIAYAFFAVCSKNKKTLEKINKCTKIDISSKIILSEEFNP